MHHYLRPLLEPASIALVGASERGGSLGAVVFDNLLTGGFKGAVYPVNPAHRRLRDRSCWPDLAAIGKPVDLAIIAAPPRAVPAVLEGAAQAQVRVAVVMTVPVPGGAGQQWLCEVAGAARRGGVRMIGPGAIGIVRPKLGLNATSCAPLAQPGRLALVAQSGAVATAMLDFATPLGVGFSSVISLGLGGDVGFGEILECLLLDVETEGIVLYIERLAEAREFVSALRAAARMKPVVVLKAGRSLEPAAAVTADAVFDAAMTRSGTVRVQTYAQLFAAARILAVGRIPRGDRVAIVANGRGPALLAADCAGDRGVVVPAFGSAVVERLRLALADAAAGDNPVDVRGDATGNALVQAAAIALDDPGIDALIALHVPRPSSPAVETARALAPVAKAQAKPVLAAWLGALDRDDVRAALDGGGVPNFHTPETAVEALSFLIAYRRNQAWLLEVPPPQPEPEPPDLVAVEALRAALQRDRRRSLTPDEALGMLAAFGVGSTVACRANEQEAEAATRAMRFAVTVSISVVPDVTFGPVITLARGAGGRDQCGAPVAMLPPLNARLAREMIAGAGADAPHPSDPHSGVANTGASVEWLDAACAGALTELLIRVSALVCALPWVEALDLDPVLLDGDRAFVASVQARVDPRRRLQRGYPHMAIHPYPVELISELSLRDGTRLTLRPIRPEDAELERGFVAGLSEQTRYFRFFYRMSELAPAMLARFTQVDYDRELALVALTGVEEGGSPAFVAVARYLASPDLGNSEFAIVVGDAWQRRGIATLLMRKLIECAKLRGFARMSGVILRENDAMLSLMRALGFAIEDDPEDPAQVLAVMTLA
ncbi:MAG: GNAT family N-acetyltransferase [Casimicrobiaceae bacterium]